MLSVNRIKFIHSLQNKKHRDLQRMFIAEGTKLVLELLKSHFAIEEILVVPEKVENVRPVLDSSGIPVTAISTEEMRRISALTSPSPALAVVKMAESSLPPALTPDNLVLALDNIRDPGNMGTIIRIADWFGISTIICSEECVDLYNPKVVQATMGSIARVRVHMTGLPAFIASLQEESKIYGTFMEGENLYETDLEESGIIIIGNEANGISESVAGFVTDKLSIPAFPVHSKNHAESLNASVATAIICAEFRRRSLYRK